MKVVISVFWLPILPASPAALNSLIVSRLRLGSLDQSKEHHRNLALNVETRSGTLFYFKPKS